MTAAHVESWLVDDEVADPDALRAETAAKIGDWQALGGRLADAFLDYAAGRSSRLDHSCHEPA